jgi:hypothetical protein
MKNANTALPKHTTPKHVELSEQELDDLLDYFTTDRQKRIISGITNNPGILSHDAERELYCTYIPSFVQSVSVRLSKLGLKIIAVNPDSRGRYFNSSRWYLCLLSELEYFDVEIMAANDEILS